MRAVLIESWLESFSADSLSFPFKTSHGYRGEFSCARRAIYKSQNSKSSIYHFRRKLNLDITITKSNLEQGWYAIFKSPIGICGAKGVVTL